MTKDNGGSLTGGNSQPITFYFRSVIARHDDQYTSHLNTKCNAQFKAPYNAVPVPGTGTQRCLDVRRQQHVAGTWFFGRSEPELYRRDAATPAFWLVSNRRPSQPVTWLAVT